MIAAAQPRLRLVLDVIAWRYGIGAAVGLGLVASAGLFWLFQVRPLGAAAEALNLAPHEQASEAQHGPQPRAVASLLRDRLQVVMPDKADAHIVLAELVEKAGAHGIEVESIDVQSRDDARAGWSQASYSAPLQGGYPAVRRLLETLLRDHPHLTLDQVSFRRDDTSDRRARAQVRLTGWYRISAPARDATDKSVPKEDAR